MFERVQEQRKGSFSTQREAVAFVVDERIAAGRHS
jgi:hypothetical protein